MIYKLTSRTDTSTPIKNVNVTLPVLKVTKLPVAVEFEEQPSDLDDGIISVKYSENNLNVAVLDSADIQSAVLGKINFSDLYTGDNTFTFDTANIQGVTVLDENIKQITVEVTVSSDYEVKYVKIDNGDIKLENITDGYTASVSDTDFSNAWIIAPKSYTPDAADIEVKCDLSKQEKSGKYPLTITVSNNQSWIYGAYNATVDITVK